jgi:hypothetical protein
MIIRLTSLLLLLTFAQNLYSAEAVVTVLQTPLFSKNKIDSRITQYVRKGVKVFVHDKDIGINPYKDNGYLDKDADAFQDEKFYKTFNKLGAETYIQKSHVKIIYNDHREYAEPIRPFKLDPTDYRLSEPLPKGYPLSSGHPYRSYIALGTGPGQKDNYSYPEGITSENFTNRVGFQGAFSGNPDFDSTNRFFFGVQYYGFNEQASFNLSNGNKALETRYILGVGPYVAFDAVRTDDYKITIDGGITYNYTTQSFIIQSSNADETRAFSGLFLTPRLGSFVEFSKVFGDADIIAKVELEFAPPHTLATGAEANDTSAWNPGTSHDVPFAINSMVFLGIQSRY